MSTPVEQRCPNCRTLLRFTRANVIGKRADCPKCKTRFIIEGPKEVSAEIIESATQYVDARHRSDFRRREQQARTSERLEGAFRVGWWLFVIGLSVLLTGTAALYMAWIVDWYIPGNRSLESVQTLGILVGVGAGVLGTPLLIAGYIYFLVVLYRAWAVIQDGRARTSPGAAVGLLFVPFFNAYWVFVAFCGLARDLNGYALRHKLKAPPASPYLGIAVSLFSCLGILPFLGAVAAVLNVFVLPSFFRSVSRTAAALCDARPQPDLDQLDEFAVRSRRGVGSAVAAALLAFFGLTLFTSGLVVATSAGRYDQHFPLFVGILLVGLFLLLVALFLTSFTRLRDDGSTKQERTKPPKPLLLFAGIMLVFLGGSAALWWLLVAGETTQEVLDRYKTKFAAKRLELQSIAGKLPPPGSVKKNQGRRGLNPEPIYDPKARTFNTSVVMADQLRDPDIRLAAPEQVDLILHHGRLLINLQWTGTQSPLPESRRARRAGAELANHLDATLAQPYLVVARPVRYQPPAALLGRSFTGGIVELEAFLVDCRNHEIVASVRALGTADPVPSSTQGNIAHEAYYSMRRNACRNLARRLMEETNGTFVFD